MKTLNNILLALSATAVLGTTGLFAQNRAVADIPFEFTVSNVSVPAGEYTLIEQSAQSDMIRIVNDETRKSVMVLALHTGTDHSKAATGKVIFHRYGDRYFLAGVWTPNGLDGRVPPSKEERELKSEKEMASISIPLAAAQ